MSMFGMLLLLMFIMSMFGKSYACYFHYYDCICQCHTNVKVINIANVMLLFLRYFYVVSLVCVMHFFMLSLLI